MTAIEVPGLQYDRVVETGIRPFDITRDLRPVAELISVAFAHELDERGNSALREMRFMSHFGGFLSLVNRSTGELNDMLSGYVWVEAGKIVGNVTVQRADKFGSRWQIANVAVAPAYRGRGISRRLMETALQHTTKCGGQWVVLQVYARNDVAQRLYDSLDFEEVGGTIDLLAESLSVTAEEPANDHLVAFRSSEWQPLYELANCQLGGQAQWWHPIRRSDFQQTVEEQIGEWFQRVIGQRTVFRRAVQVSPRFEAALILSARGWKGRHEIQLWARPEHYGTHDTALINWALAKLQEFPRWPISASISTTHDSARELLEHHGFIPQRTLLTLRRRVGPER